MPRGMAGQKQNMQRGVSKLNGITFFEKLVRQSLAIAAKSVVGGVRLHSPEDRFIVGVNQKLDLVFFFDVIIAKNVINMAMGVEKVLNRQLLSRNKIIQFLPFFGLVTPGSITTASRVSSKATMVFS